MDFISSELNRYAEAHTSDESPLLKRIERETRVGVHMSRMISGHLQGRFLSLLTKMIRPRNILEIGTYTGYSAICLAEGLTPGGKLFTIDINEELESRVRNYFDEAGMSEKIQYSVGDAVEIISTLPGPFDFVFLDADKENYARYFDLVIDKIPSGGFILADNVLWSGKVLNQKLDKDTKAIKAFNNKIQEDERVENVLLPVRDGIMIIRKI